MSLSAASTITTRDELRTAALLDTRPEQVQLMAPDELASLQFRLGYGDRYGIWSTPREWMPAGSRKKSLLHVDFRKRLSFLGVADQQIDDAVLYCARYAVLLALFPLARGRRTGNRLLKSSSIASTVYRNLPPLVAMSFAQKSGNSNGLYVKALREEDFQTFSDSQQKYFKFEMARMHKFCDRELWRDRPSIGRDSEEISFTPDVAGQDIRPKKESKTDQYKPLPDEWVADAGWRILWFVQNIGPNLLILGRHLAQIVHDHPHLGSGVTAEAIRQKRRRLGLRCMAAHRWIDQHGHEIVQLPFSLTVRVGANTPALEPGQWPPTHVPHILKLMELLQYAHLFAALLAVGSRISEMLSIVTGAITRSSDGTPYANGLTFKLSQMLDGEERDWPLPDVVLKAIEQQETLRKVLTDIGFWSMDPNDNRSSPKAHLWASYGTTDELSTTTVNANLRTLIESFGLPMDPDEQMLSTHRFRKTISRLVALAVTGAPKVLMDLLGHKSIEMTLYYILADPDIAAEVKRVSEELIIMRATTAIENINDYGGSAAKTIKRMKEKERHRLGKELGADDVRGLAEILTMNGQAWELARPGVICTKLPGTYGECAKKAGHPEPSHCGSDCDHRLEEAFLRADVDGAIADSIRHYETERDADNGLMQDFWAGQILTHLKRFDDLKNKWSSHPSVQEIAIFGKKSA